MLRSWRFCKPTRPLARKLSQTPPTVPPPSPNFFYVRGKWVKEEEATLPIRDLAILRGYGVFDYLRTYNGQPLTLEQNLKRLQRSCSLIDLEIPWTKTQIRRIVNQTLQKNIAESKANPNQEFDIRIIISGGIAADNVVPDSLPSLVVMVRKLAPLPTHWIKEGVKIITFDDKRSYPTAKTTNYISAVRSQKMALKSGAVESVYVSKKKVYEGTTSNIFAVFGDKLVTPNKEILLGITRGIVLDLAKEHQIEVEERTLTYEELLTADEVFLTAANKRVLPVVQIDESVVKEGKPGPNTIKVMDLFDRFCGVKE